jgi:hypothetical protein
MGSEHSSSEVKLHVGKFVAPMALKGTAHGLTTIGVLVFLMGVTKDPQAMWPGYLTAFFFVSCLGMGGLFWAAINSITKAGWSSSIRRIVEGMTSFIPVIPIGGLLILFVGLKYLYPWARPEEIAAEPAIAAKTAYLNPGFAAVRLLIFGLGSLFFGAKIIGNSLKQDATGDENLTLKTVGWSIAFILFFALSFSFFSVDFLMSLLPSWYSTIFGIYCFAGLFQSSLAFMILLLIFFQRSGMVQGYYNQEHIHDVAKFMKGFTVFWAYIAFSQFMLIWYANIPEETEFYLMRSQNGWMMVSMALLVFKFIVPFLALLPRAAKRNQGHLILVACLILVMQYVDIFWLVKPNFQNNQMSFGIYDIGLLAGFLGIFLLGLMRFYGKHSLVALKDPRLHEALHHEVTY